MKLEDQVCSLELSKKLKEMGVPQESVWYWVSVGGVHPSGETLSTDIYLEIVGQVEELEQSPHHYGEDIEVRQKYSAYTVAELGEMLPLEVKDYKDKGYRILSMETGHTLVPSGWFFSYKDLNPSIGLRHYKNAGTEANARAKMLAYLLENKLITL